MVWYSIAMVVDFLLDLFMVRWKTPDKDLEILLLRQQLRVLERRRGQHSHPGRWEKYLLAVLFSQLKQTRRRSRAALASILIFRPQTLLNWHRELVRRKRTFIAKRRVGRPAITDELRRLVIRLANENVDWGYDRIQGELLKLGCTIDSTTVKNVLKCEGSNWRTFLQHYKHQMLACAQLIQASRFRQGAPRRQSGLAGECTGDQDSIGPVEASVTRREQVVGRRTGVMDSLGGKDDRAAQKVASL